MNAFRAVRARVAELTTPQADPNAWVRLGVLWTFWIVGSSAAALLVMKVWGPSVPLIPAPPRRHILARSAPRSADARPRVRRPATICALIVVSRC